MVSSQKSAAKLMLAVVVGLIVLKVLGTVITGSISILAQAADSSLDLFAAVTTLVAIRIAIKPADKEHPFGHGKVENVSAIVQALLIFSAGGLIIYSSVQRILTGAAIKLTEAGMGVMLFSIVVSIFLSRHLLRVAQAVDSIALEANAHNIAADVYSAAAVLVGLAVVRFTRLNILDPIIAITVALLILKAAYSVLRKSFGGLVDTKLPDAEERVIMDCITEHNKQVVSFHKLRTRKGGKQRYIDLHLVIPKDASLEEAHLICDDLERHIAEKLGYASVTIHVEPCTIECYQCSVVCHLRRQYP